MVGHDVVIHFYFGNAVTFSISKIIFGFGKKKKLPFAIICIVMGEKGLYTFWNNFIFCDYK